MHRYPTEFKGEILKLSGEAAKGGWGQQGVTGGNHDEQPKTLLAANGKLL